MSRRPPRRRRHHLGMRLWLAVSFALVGALLLVLLVAGAGAGIAWWQGTVRDEKDVEQDLGIACLGTIPDLLPRKGGRT